MSVSNAERESKPGRDISYCIDANYAKGTNTTLKSRRQLVMEIRESTDTESNESRITQTHTIAYSKSHRTCEDTGKKWIDARGKIDDEANTLNTGDGCTSQSTGNYVFTKVDKEIDMKLVGNAYADRGQSGSIYELEDDSVSFTITSTYPRSPKFIIEDNTKFTKVDKDMADIKFVGGVNPKKTWNKDDNRNLSRNYSQGERIHHPDGISPCISSNMGGTANGSTLITESNIRIRKLTPVECERLMSWPDNWTKFGTDENGKTYELSNSARYKACGNGIVSNIPKALLDHVTGSEQGLRVFSTFAGVDGSGLYLESPKYIKVGFSEFDPQSKAQHAANVLRYHYPEVPNLGDITKIDVKDVPDHDIIFISAPCQSFSSAGKNLGIEDTRGTLFYETARIMKEKLPRWFIFENVKNLLSKKHEDTFEKMCEIYSELGYELDFELINSKYYSTAQNRERVFMIGKLK